MCFQCGEILRITEFSGSPKTLGDQSSSWEFRAEVADLALPGAGVS